jgi:hypothetical protein
MSNEGGVARAGERAAGLRFDSARHPAP